MGHGQKRAPSGYSRRDFIRGLGLGAAGTVLLGSGALGGLEAEAPAASAATSAIQESDSAHFGRMFGNLPFFGQNMDQDKLKAALLDLGRPGGILDAGDALVPSTEDQARALITDPALRVNNPDNPTHTAGTTFVGQFFDHDLTFDISSLLGIPKDPTISPTGRTPAFDLDSVYGGGPTVCPQLYDPTGVKFRVESGGLFEDLPRNVDLTAIIPDPRNDENLVISGLHCAFLLFHNAVVDWVNAHDQGNDPAEVFAQARQLTTWHYQWMMVHEFLPLFVGHSMVDDVLSNGRKFYKPIRHVPFIPVEFQAAAYRFGHSMVRPSYRANFTGENYNFTIKQGSQFFAFIFDDIADDDSSSTDTSADPDDLSGGHRAVRRFIGWHTFFDFGDNPATVRRNKMIDTKISTPLFKLPSRAIPGSQNQPPNPLALPQRNLLRQVTWSLPSGQAVAGAIGAPVLSSDDLSDLHPIDQTYGTALQASTPLWYYILREAELPPLRGPGGLTLGPVGGRIVAEVFIGLLQLDRNSYISQGWTPTLPQMSGKVTGDFKMVDFLTFAGVGQQR